MNPLTSYRFFLTAALLILLSACGKQEKAAETTEKPAARPNTDTTVTVTLTGAQFKTAAIQLGLPENGRVENKIRFSGKLELPPDSRAQVGSLTAGEIVQIRVAPGDRVTLGMELARIAHPDIIQLQEDYLKTAAAQRFAAEELKRQEELEADKVGKTKNLQKARADYDEGEAKLQGLRKKLKLLNIPVPQKEGETFVNSVPVLSPLNGAVVSADVSLGQFVQTGTALFTLADASRLQLAVQVYERDLPQVKPGQAVEFKLANLANPLKGKVKSITPFIDPTSRAALVYITPNAEANRGLIPNEYVYGTINTEAQELPTLPEEAFARMGTRHYIFVTRQNAPADSASRLDFEMLEVSQGGKTESAGGGRFAFQPVRPLLPDEKIAVSGAYFILSEMRKGENEE